MQTATDYKRKPILTEDERYKSVAVRILCGGGWFGDYVLICGGVSCAHAMQACKYVHKVVKDAPLKTDETFIKKHQIHVFAVGEEYVNDPEDEFYAVPRRLGILKATARTDGISTSQLIKRIESRDKSTLGRVAPPKQGV